MDVQGIFKSSIRVTPSGFCWEFTGRDSTTNAQVAVTLYFDFAWVRQLATDLHRMLADRDAETEAARRVLMGDK